MPTFFFRSSEFKGAPGLELSRVVAAAMHLSIPLVMYSAMYNGVVFHWLSQYINLHELSEDRKALYLFLDCFYSVRWAIGVLIMQGELTLSLGIIVALKHLLCDEFGYGVGSMLVNSWGTRTGPLTTRDYTCAFLMIVAGILQHGSEIQRWLFKRNPSNKGKIHTGGLFYYARGINHTGHILRDMAHVLMVPNLFFVLFYPVPDYDLACQIVPETQNHMKQKYGEQWEKYEKQTPYVFLPGLF
ncbi:Ergosterol biosynthesis ERG4/ERG24 family [Seminavis robusta]|uniref:Ergosterol biosynthesis ERG4/ERG24 family n=1 Tax=Seminavis robusta TaxID=568900 RepID=A0A9N8HQQ0_9STRA|nr:Ergosterol biosynthesis ERG4/ERG24 family [Seminavis robusta]|eukprot:Sro1186_g250330.1 Ergosterol biosynthesis ERG4/ERG24 family (243) ;mRNA; f:19308-20036